MQEGQHETLVSSATSGDGQALERLLERHLPELLTYVRLHAGDVVLRKESAADLVQSVCREVLEDLPQLEYRGEPAFRKWLFMAALNKIRDRGRYHQMQKREVERELTSASEGAVLERLLPTSTTPSQVAIGEERRRQLEQAFARLPEDYRHVITAAKILGQSHREIAAELGRSEAAVRVLLHRALFRLGALIGE